MTLLRKLPALVHLVGQHDRSQGNGPRDQSALARDLKAMLEAELLKDDPSV